MYHGNDKLINLAVVVIAFLLIGRLKRSLGETPSETYGCGRCHKRLYDFAPIQNLTKSAFGTE